MRYLDMVLAQPLPADFSLVVAEIRSFELLHQTHGPASCGELVRRVAGRLALGVDAPDVVAYLGAGRFGWLTEQGNAEDLQRRLLQCVELPVKIDEEPVYISAKIGVVHGPRAFASAEDVVRDGIIAAQQARSAEDASNVFESDMRLQPLEDLRLELSLRQAVAENAFRLEYQPIVDLGTGALVGFESLVRWTTADGPVSPARFIPVAERTGLIAPIGRWVLATAAMQAARWNVSRSRPVLVSVNVSAHQITPALVDDLRTLLAHTGLHPSLLKLEFTETAIADDPRVVGVLDECRALGVQVWIDDFGTGFSSLAYLQRFPISGLKVDKCFVDPLDGTPQSASMAKAILYIADAIGVETVAEGIETEAQRQQLRELGYRWGQGYLFSRPLRVDAAEELLSRSD
jgi:EAL domain-containing protein (putative c-di-GMP-specific phosphodiesterase class I)/GGDEF domain-containing protein